MFDKVKKWLDEMNLKYGVNSELKLFHIPWDVDGIKFSTLLMVTPDNKWIKAAAQILKAEDVPEGLYRSLLKANWDLFDVTYSIDEKGNVYSENDISSESNYAGFRSEIAAIVFGVRYFFNTVAPKFDIAKKETFEKLDNVDYE
ncbi:MAG: hypothetical protein ACFFD4_16025 [Candidatus Odinarchaeota archaeon]